MPSPIGHSIAGFLICVWWNKIRSWVDCKRAGKSILLCMCAASIADIDFLPSIALGYGDQLHQGITHTFFAAFLIPIGMLVCSAGSIRETWKTYWMLCACYCSHIALDCLVQDHTVPYGLRILMPFSRQFFYTGIGVFLPIIRENICSWHNFYAVSYEMMIFTVFLCIVFLYNYLFLKTADQK